MLFVGLSTAIKRLWLATFLGRRSYAHYSSELEILLGKMLLISQVGQLAREIDQQIFSGQIGNSLLYPMKAIAFANDASDSESENNIPSIEGVVNPNGQSSTMHNGFGKTLLDAGGRIYSSRLGSTRTTRRSSPVINSSTRNDLMNLLEEWEEPDYQSRSKSKGERLA